jgi:hypothetical protein
MRAHVTISFEYSLVRRMCNARILKRITSALLLAIFFYLSPLPPNCFRDLYPSVGTRPRRLPIFHLSTQQIASRNAYHERSVMRTDTGHVTNWFVRPRRITHSGNWISKYENAKNTIITADRIMLFDTARQCSYGQCSIIRWFSENCTYAWKPLSVLANR